MKYKITGLVYAENSKFEVSAERDYSLPVEIGDTFGSGQVREFRTMPAISRFRADNDDSGVLVTLSVDRRPLDQKLSLDDAMKDYEGIGFAARLLGEGS